MSTTSGISEKVEVIEEGTWGAGTGDGVEFGFIEGLSWKADTHSKSYYSADGLNKPNDIIDGIIEFSGDLVWKLVDGREFEGILGTLIDAGAGSYTLAIATTVPSYSFKALLSDAQNVHVKGAYFTKFDLKLNKDEIVKVTGNWIAQTIIELGTSITPDTPAYKPYMFTDGFVTINGGTAVVLDSINLGIDRQAMGYRGIEAASTNEKRLITSIVDKNITLTGSGSAIAKKDFFENLLGGATLIDYRTKANIVITLSNTNNTIAFTLPALLTNFNKTTTANSDIIVIDFDYIATDVTGAGTYPAP